MVTEETETILADVPAPSELSESQPFEPYEPSSETADEWEPAEPAETVEAEAADLAEPTVPAPRQRKARSAARRTAGKRAARPTKKTAAKKAAGKKAAPKRAAHDGSGSPHLADSLTGLLNDVTVEVATVSALSAAIDDAARALRSQLEEYNERVGTLSRLRQSVSGGTLAAFLDETLVPDPPTELESLAGGIQAAQSASI